MSGKGENVVDMVVYDGRIEIVIAEPVLGKETAGVLVLDKETGYLRVVPSNEITND